MERWITIVVFNVYALLFVDVVLEASAGSGVSIFENWRRWTFAMNHCEIHNVCESSWSSSKVMLCFHENSPSSIFCWDLPQSVGWRRVVWRRRLWLWQVFHSDFASPNFASESSVISKKHCKLELRGGEAWNDEVVLLVECLCWHGWCWTLWFFNWISRIFKPKPGPIVWANVSNEWCWLIVGNLCGFCFWVYFA